MTTTDQTVLDAAVRIATEAMTRRGERVEFADDYARAVIDALHRAGWLHDPDEIERDRDAARAEIDRLAIERQHLRRQLNDLYDSGVDGAR